MLRQVKLLMGALVAATCILLGFLSTKYEPVVTPVNVSRVYPLFANRESPEGEAWKPSKVLIFAYARSGSSLTGDIINHSPSVYYVFEPLRQIFAFYNETEVRIKKSMAVLQALFTCNFSATMLSVMDNNFLKRNVQTEVLGKCSRHLYNPRTRRLKQCIKKAQAVCKSHSVVAVKTIRLSMTTVKDLMTLNPDLAIIFLVRDPRATIWSRMNVFKSPKKEGLRPFTDHYCQNIDKDLAVAQKLFDQYPARLRFVRYEDLAQWPVPVFRNIYRFLHLNWTQAIKDLTEGQMHSSERKHNTTRRRSYQYAYSVKRSNSSATANEWRLNIPFNVLRVIERRCAKVMRLLGYQSLETLDAVRENSIASRENFTYIQDFSLSDADMGRVMK